MENKSKNVFTACLSFKIINFYVKKGSLLGIIGSLKLDRWTDRASGEERSKPVVRVDRLELLGSKRDAEQGGGFPGGGNEEDVPF